MHEEQERGITIGHGPDETLTDQCRTLSRRDMARGSTEASTIEPLNDNLYGSHIKQDVCHRPLGRVKLARPFSYYVSELEVRQSKSRRPRGCRNITPFVAYRPMTEEEYNARLKMLNRKSQFSFRAVITPYQPA